MCSLASILSLHWFFILLCSFLTFLFIESVSFMNSEMLNLVFISFKFKLLFFCRRFSPLYSCSCFNNFLWNFLAIFIRYINCIYAMYISILKLLDKFCTLQILPQKYTMTVVSYNYCC